MDKVNNTNTRIELLDSFRSIAIILVMLYHYFERWRMPIHKENLYDYDLPTDFFKYGYLGVELFFIISGYVIAYTLMRTDSFSIFWKKRMIRLFPTMLLCSLITFVVFTLFDSTMLFQSSHKIENFFFSLTFLSPLIPIDLLGFNLNYMDGSYWSLWVEIQFYFIVSLVYFFNKEKFFVRFLILSVLGFFASIFMGSNTGNELLSIIFTEKMISNIKLMFTIFNVFEYNLWFVFGVILFKLHGNKGNVKLLATFFLIVLLQLYFLRDFVVIMFSLSFICLFLLLIYYQKALWVLNNKLISNVGVASYSLYLIHQNIGVLIITKLEKYFGVYNFILPLLIMTGLTVFSYYSYKWIEQPLSKILSKYFIKKPTLVRTDFLKQV